MVKSVKIINGKPVNFSQVIVHQFAISSDDPELFAGEELYNWEHSEPGKFIKSHAVDVSWRKTFDHVLWNHRFAIVAEIEDRFLSQFYLKWGNNGCN